MKFIHRCRHMHGAYINFPSAVRSMVGNDGSRTFQTFHGGKNTLNILEGHVFVILLKYFRRCIIFGRLPNVHHYKIVSTHYTRLPEYQIPSPDERQERLRFSVFQTCSSCKVWPWHLRWTTFQPWHYNCTVGKLRLTSNRTLRRTISAVE